MLMKLTTGQTDTKFDCMWIRLWDEMNMRQKLGKNCHLINFFSKRWNSQWNKGF